MQDYVQYIEVDPPWCIGGMAGDRDYTRTVIGTSTAM